MINVERPEELKALIAEIITANISAEAWNWLNTYASTNSVSALNIVFGIMPRKTGKAIIRISAGQQALLQIIRPGLLVDNWTADRLCRVWVLSQFNEPDKDKYFHTIENLFSVAEMNEEVALYSALPLLNHPEMWVNRCAQGIRSNIGVVLEAIMYGNPYPAANLSEAAWNQMVLKAFFTEKQVDKLYGLDDRANKELARILIDYASERHAAGREVNAMLWYLVEKFVNPEELSSMKQGKFHRIEFSK